MFTTYQCLYCNDAFLKEQDLMGHIKRVHEAPTRETELFLHSQASDYSRKLAYREERNHLRLNFADVLLILFAGIMGTLFIALIVG